MEILKVDDDFYMFNSAVMYKKFPMGVYLYETSKTGPYLHKIPNLKKPAKVYNNDKDFIEHILYTWRNTNESIGILLKGKKGLGKSFTANLLCASLEQELFVAKVTKELHKNDDIISFLNEIEQDHIIYIDEFEKIFTLHDNAEDQRMNQKVFLSYLDGGNKSNARRMFIITANDDVNDFFLNRPSRLRYVRDYSELNTEVIREIIEDRLVNQDYLEDLTMNLDNATLNIDILISIIDEINLHNKPYSSFKPYFNYQHSNQRYNVFVKYQEIIHDLPQIHGYEVDCIKNDKRGIDLGTIQLVGGETIDVNWERNVSKWTLVGDNELSLQVRGCHYNKDAEFIDYIPLKVTIQKFIQHLVY